MVVFSMIYMAGVNSPVNHALNNKKYIIRRLFLKDLALLVTIDHLELSFLKINVLLSVRKKEDGKILVRKTRQSRNLTRN